jgi:hypothetical protein
VNYRFAPQSEAKFIPTQTIMNTTAWIAYYQSNTGSFLEPDWNQPCRLPEGSARKALGESLAIFQLGETGDGSTLQKWAQRECRNDPNLQGYPAAVRLFIREENFHADLLSRMVVHLGGQLRTKHWAAWAFNRIRKLIPRLEYEIQILLSAELIARAYYALLARLVPEPSIQQCCARLVRDEIKHIAFHAEFFHERFAPWSRLAVRVWQWQFKTLFRIAEMIVWSNHRQALTGLGVDKALFQKRCRASFADFIRQITVGDSVNSQLRSGKGSASPLALE